MPNLVHAQLRTPAVMAEMVVRVVVANPNEHDPLG